MRCTGPSPVVAIRFVYLTRLFVVYVLLCATFEASALEPRTENTFNLSENETPPAVTIEAASFLIGTWQGTAFGQTFEAHWNPPSAGTMVGTFKLIKDGVVSFYEILVMDVVDGRLTMKVKHFNQDFTAWEEKGDYVEFKLVGVAENQLHFSGISFYRNNDQEMDAFIVMKSEKGIREEKLRYRRAD